MGGRRRKISAVRRHSLQLALTFGSQGTERALTFVAVTLVLRVLPVADSGAFVLMLKVAGFTTVLATLGIQGGAVQMISVALGEGREYWANAVLRAFLWTRVTMVVPLILVGFTCGSWIAEHVFGQAAAGAYIRWGFISAAANAILSFSLHHLQARQSFVRYAALTVLTTFGKLAAVAILITAAPAAPLRQAHRLATPQPRSANCRLTTTAHGVSNRTRGRACVREVAAAATLRSVLLTVSRTVL